MSFSFGGKFLNKPVISIDKPIRLIELFGGVGTQAMAMRDIGAKFERYRLVEFEQHSVDSYNAIHGTNFTTQDIRDVHSSDLGIVDTDKYEYIMFYSFPCTALSNAGKRTGMKRGVNETSSLLWEVQRLIDECHDNNCLPQILFMENVIQVHNDKNIDDFNEWISYLQGLGYSSHYANMNSVDYGVAQNRERTFMVSVLGDYDFKFPNRIKLEKSIDDYLETNIPDKYYLEDERNRGLIENLDKRGFLPLKKNYYIDDNYCGNRQCRVHEDIASTLTVSFRLKMIAAMRGRNPDNPSDRTAGIKTEQRLEINSQNVCNTLTTVGKDNLIIEEEQKDKINLDDYHVRKLTPLETWRLMGYTDEDFNKAASVNKDLKLWEQAGNAIVKQCLMALFSQLHIKGVPVWNDSHYPIYGTPESTDIYSNTVLK